MEQQERHTTSDLAELPLGRPDKYSFYCAVAAILGALDHSIEEAPLRRQHVEGLVLRTNACLGHPKAEVETIVARSNTEADWIELEANVFGLNGTVSPLPSYLSEAILESRQDDGTLHEFTDFINNRLLWMLFLSMRKYRYESRYVQGGQDMFSDWMFAFCGATDRDVRTTRKLPWAKILSLLGVVAMPSRSGGMIAATISHCFGIDMVRVQEFEERRVEIPREQMCHLGRQNTTLGVDTVSGARVLSYDSKIAVVFADLDFDRYRALLPNGELHAQVIELMNLLLNDPLAIDFVLGLRNENVPDFTLGQERSSRLGWSSFLGGAGKQRRREARIKARG